VVREAVTLILPTLTDGTPWYDFSIDLDGRTFLLEFHWNARDVAWYLTIYDQDENLLLAGRKLVLDFPLLARFMNPMLPAGEFFVVDTSAANEPPGLTDLGSRVVLLYVEQADLPSSFLSP
jgi:hypothetical protein